MRIQGGEDWDQKDLSFPFLPSLPSLAPLTPLQFVWSQNNLRHCSIFEKREEKEVEVEEAEDKEVVEEEGEQEAKLRRIFIFSTAASPIATNVKKPSEK